MTHRRVLCYGIDILHPQAASMPNSISPLIEQPVPAFASAHPPPKSQRISDE